MTNVAWEVQTAVYAALIANPDVQAIVGSPARIFDAIPDDVAFPFVQLGATQMKALPGSEGGIEHLLRITIFSRWGGRSESKHIAGTIRSVLQNAELPLTDHTMVLSRLVFEDHLRLRDPDTFQASMRFRIVTMPEEVAV
ncbi:MAG: DUF3168 domain-containing protein [Pseudomonadota bacterium]